MAIGTILIGRPETLAPQSALVSMKVRLGNKHEGFLNETSTAVFSLAASGASAPPAPADQAVQFGPPPAATSFSGSSAMSGNFVSTESKQSRYVQASIKSAQGQKTLSNARDSQLATLMLVQQLFLNSNQKIDVLMKRVAAGKHIGEESQKNLDETKEVIEEKAQEAVAATDENGQPIDVLHPDATPDATSDGVPEIAGQAPSQENLPDQPQLVGDMPGQPHDEVPLHLPGPSALPGALPHNYTPVDIMV